jgi:hypothetical protein
MEGVAAVDQNVVGLNVAVSDAYPMQIFQSTEKLTANSLDVELGQVSMFIDHTSKITTGDKLHDDVQVVMPIDVLDVLDNIGLWLLVK